MAYYTDVQAKLRRHVALVLDEDELKSWGPGVSGSPPLKWAFTAEGRVQLSADEMGALLDATEALDSLVRECDEVRESFQRALDIAARLADIDRPRTIDALAPRDLRWLEELTDEDGF